LNSKPRNFSEFSFEIHFETEEVPMEKVVPFFKTLAVIFYLKKLELMKVLLDRLKSNLAMLPVTVASGPHVSVPGPCFGTDHAPPMSAMVEPLSASHRLPVGTGPS
jgi:hypothetical protein